MSEELMITKEDLVNWLDRPPSNDDLDLIGFITTRLENFYKLEQELNQKDKIIEETIDYVKYLKKNMGIDEYYLEKIYPEKYIDKILSKLEKGSEE